MDIQETTQVTAYQRLHTPNINVVPEIPYTEEWCQKYDSDPVADKKTFLPSANLV